MVYNVIIALNSTGKRRVGNVISVLERNGLELVEIRKKSTHPLCREFADINLLLLQNKLNDLKAMDFYREKFSSNVLVKKLRHFYGNHVELFFENEDRFIDPDELWEKCKNTFENQRKFPIMFVTTTSGENGFNSSFIPDSFEPDGLCSMG